MGWHAVKIIQLEYFILINKKLFKIFITVFQKIFFILEENALKAGIKMVI